MPMLSSVARSSLLAGASLLTVLAAPAFAACAPNPTVANGTTNCTGVSGPLTVGTDGSTVVLPTGASIEASFNPAINTTSRSSTLNLDGRVFSASHVGIRVQSGTSYYDPDPYAGVGPGGVVRYPWVYPHGATSIIVGATGEIEGTAGIQVVRPSYNPYANVFANIDNSGIIRGSIGTAIGGESNGQVSVAISNRAGGQIIGDIVAGVTSLDNAGNIAGGIGISRVDPYGWGYSTGTITNSGTIVSVNYGISSEHDHQTIINSGSIITDGGMAIRAAGSLKLDNQSGGLIETTGQLAIRSTGSADIVNRGAINGSVHIGQGYSTSGSRFSNLDGGVVNGNLIFGAADDVLVVTLDSDGVPVFGVTGLIDGGLGLNRVEIGIATDQTATASISRPLNFQQIGIAISDDATATLAFDSDAAIAISGTGTLVNQGNITTSGSAIVRAGFAQPVVRLQNEGTINASLSNVQQAALDAADFTSITNSGTIAAAGGAAIKAGEYYTQLNLTNSGTISSDTIAIRFGAYGGKIVNEAGGVISAPTAIGHEKGNYGWGQIQIDNAGSIDGAIDLVDVYGQIILIQREGGTITGDVLLGQADDVLFLDRPLTGGIDTGITGLIDGGAGRDTVLARVTQDGSTSLGSFTNFELMQFDMDADVVLTLTGAANGTGIAFSGAGEVVLSADIATTGMAINGLADRGLLPGEPYVYPQERPTSIHSSGAITVALDPSSYWSGTTAIQLGHNTDFTNTGAISLTAQQWGGGVAISQGRKIVNEGTISTVNATAISSAQQVVNSGTIEARGTNTYGVASVATLTNSGRVAADGYAVMLYGSSPTGSFLENSGTIESYGSTAIHVVGYATTRITNSATGVIRAAAGHNAIFTNYGPGQIINEGSIIGDVALTGYNDVYLSAGGTLAGDLRLTGYAGTVLVEGGSAGISGTIEANWGGGHSWGQYYRANATHVLGGTLPDGFEGEAAYASGRDTVVTLSGTTGRYRPLTLYGDGSIVNQALAGQQTATVELRGALQGEGSLSFINESNLRSVYGMARSVVNNATIHSDPYANGVSINPAHAENFQFRNGGTIIGGYSDLDWGGATYAVEISESQRSGLEAVVDNSGTIDGGIRAYFSRTLTEFTNNGTIQTDIEYGRGVDLYGGNSDGEVRISFANTGTIAVSGAALQAVHIQTVSTLSSETPPPAEPAILFHNSGTILGDVALINTINVIDEATGWYEPHHGAIHAENSGSIDGNVWLGQGDDLFVQHVGATISGTVDGLGGANALLFRLSTSQQSVDLAQYLNFQTVTFTGTGYLPGVTGGTLETYQLAGGTFSVAQGNILETAGPVALTGSDAAETVVNEGRIIGDVALAGGNDSFANHGVVTGNIDLGDGDDVYFSGPGAQVSGIVSGGAGNDRLVMGFGGTAATPDRLDQSRFVDFQALEMTGGVLGVDRLLAYDRIAVNGGRLIGGAGSTIRAGAIHVAKGATFGSAGTVVGNVAVAGTLSPGASPGTMQVTGNVDLLAGSNSLFEITPVINDKLLVSGTVSIASGATLTLETTGGAIAGRPLDLIVADGGITGSFGTVVKPSSLFGFVRQTANRIQFLSQFANSGFNQQITGSIDQVNSHLASGMASEGFIAALPTLLTAGGDSDAADFARVNAEPYASAIQLGVENGLLLSRAARTTAVTTRETAGLFGFGQILGNWRKLPGDSALGVSATNVDSYGMIGGIGYGSADASVGAFIGYLNSKQVIAPLAATTQADGIVAGVVGRYAIAGFDLTATVAYDGGTANTRRVVPGGVATHGRYGLRNWVFDAHLGYAVDLSDAFSLSPRIGITHITTRGAAVQEQGASPFALAVARRTANATFGEAGAELALRQGGFRPWVSGGVRHQFSGEAVHATGTFAGTSASLVAIGVERPGTLATAGAGASYELAPGMNLFGGWNGEFGGSGNGHNISAGLSLRF